jgi:hypothetical protein
MFAQLITGLNNKILEKQSFFVAYRLLSNEAMNTESSIQRVVP